MPSAVAAVAGLAVSLPRLPRRPSARLRPRNSVSPITKPSQHIITAPGRSRFGDRLHSRPSRRRYDSAHGRGDREQHSRDERASGRPSSGAGWGDGNGAQAGQEGEWGEDYRRQWDEYYRQQGYAQNPGQPQQQQQYDFGNAEYHQYSGEGPPQQQQQQQQQQQGYSQAQFGQQHQQGYGYVEGKQRHYAQHQHQQNGADYQQQWAEYYRQQQEYERWWYATQQQGSQPDQHVYGEQRSGMYQGQQRWQQGAGQGDEQKLEGQLDHQRHPMSDCADCSENHSHSDSVNASSMNSNALEVDGTCDHSGHSHSHNHSDCNSHSHSHGHEETEDSCCGHSHSPEQRNEVLDRLFRITGLLVVENVLKASAKLTYPISCLSLAAALMVQQCVSASAAATMAVKALTGVVYALVGLPTFMGVCHSIAALNINTHVLTMVAVACLLPLGHAMEGALLLLLFNLSHVLEDWLTDAARGNLNSLFDSVPSTATLVDMTQWGQPDSSTERSVPADSVQIGQFVLVKAGQEVPLDGRIVSGEAMLSTEHITGESVPRRVGPGDVIAAGAVNNDGLLTVQILTIAAESTPARMARLARDAQAKKPRVQTFLERVGTQYSKAILVGTVLIALVLPLVTSVGYTAGPFGPGSFYRAAGFLTTAAPCAILISPLVYVSAIAAVTQRGILLKGGSVLDALAACKVAALDKTGTLTTGELVCTAVTDIQDSSKRSETYCKGVEALAIAQALSRGSMHPVANAVVDSLEGRAEESSLPPVDLHNFTAIPGRGVVGDCFVNGSWRQSLFGSKDWVEEHLHNSKLFHAARTLSASPPSSAGEVVSMLLQVREGEVVGMHGFHFYDRPHRSSNAAIEAIRTTGGMEVVMLSGDNLGSATAMGEMLGLRPHEVRAGLSPEDKLHAVEEMRGTGGKGKGGGVLMVGDGINDAPALAAADVGLAVSSTPSTAAAGVADGIILTSAAGVSALPFLLSIASFTQVLIRQNIALAGLAILGTALPAVLGMMPLWMGVAIHEGSTLLVALNSLRPLMHKGPLTTPHPAATTTATVTASSVGGESKGKPVAAGGRDDAGGEDAISRLLWRNGAPGAA